MVLYALAAGPDACETQVVETLGAAIAAEDQVVMDDVALPIDGESEVGEIRFGKDE